MKLFLLLPFSLLLISCGAADFGTSGVNGAIVAASSNEAETVQVVRDEDLPDIVDLNNNNDGNQTGDTDTTGNGDTDTTDTPPVVITPKEMEEDPTNSFKCDNDKKIAICHFPNGDPAKKKTLCIGRPALEAHLNHMHGDSHKGHRDYAGPCKEDENRDGSYGDDKDGDDKDGDDKDGDDKDSDDKSDKDGGNDSNKKDSRRNRHKNKC